jgi:hypothetical protein
MSGLRERHYAAHAALGWTDEDIDRDWQIFAEDYGRYLDDLDKQVIEDDGPMLTYCVHGISLEQYCTNCDDLCGAYGHGHQDPETGEYDEPCRWLD